MVGEMNSVIAHQPLEDDLEAGANIDRHVRQDYDKTDG